jgi:glycerophosphoryl diester phosphodiesterase
MDSAAAGDPTHRWTARGFDVQGHRGAKGLVVENTLESFTAAYEAGVSGIELDVRLSGDGEVVVWHDAVLLPEKARSETPGLVGSRVADLTLAQLRQVDVGSQTLEAFPHQLSAPGAHIATLAEVLSLGTGHPSDVWWTVELKVDPNDPAEVASRPLLVRKVLECLHDAGLDDRSFVHSFDWAVLELSRDLAPAVARSALVESGVTWVPGSPWTGSVRVGETHIDVCAGAAAVGAHVVSPEHVLVDEAFVARARELGLGVLPWTVNDPGTMRTLVEAGVDGLVTDYPDRAAVVLADLVAAGSGATGDPGAAGR